MEPTANENRKLYTLMVRSRSFEETAGGLVASGEMPGSWLSGIGQEGTLGVISQMRPGDYLTYTHRGAYGFLGRGSDPRPLMAELMGKRTGYGKGKGGRHIADLDHGILGKSGTVGAHAPIAVGAATAIQIRGTDDLVVSVFGDGTSNRGTTHSAMNMAAVWRLPVLWVCENNGYSGNVPASMYTAVADLVEMAAGYGMPGTVVDGNDVAAVRAAAQEALARVRDGGGPSLLELKTYRIRPFSETAADLRDPAERAVWQARDPIERFARQLLDSGDLTPADVERIAAEAAAEMAAAAEFARQSPFPDPADAFEDLYA